MVERNSRSCKQTANMMPPNNGSTGMNGNGCLGGCNQQGGNQQGSHHGTENSAACKALLHRLQALDFSIIDTVLYLNAYPNCREALAYYQKLVAERDALKKGMAQTCRTPVTNFENDSTESWDWIKGPWPWEASAN